MTILVAGATGNVGRPTVAALLSSGEPVRALSRSEDNLGNLPEGAQGAVADLETGGGLDAAFDGVDRFFLITANGGNGNAARPERRQRREVGRRREDRLPVGA